MVTAILLFAAAFFYALFMVFISRASGKMDDFFLNTVVSAVGAFLPLVVYIVLRSRGTAGENTKDGWIYSGFAGVAIAVYSVLLVKLFAGGGNLAYVTPAVYGGAIVMSSLIGWLVLHESMAPLQLLGMVLVAVGISCIVAAKL